MMHALWLHSSCNKMLFAGDIVLNLSLEIDSWFKGHAYLHSYIVELLLVIQISMIHVRYVMYEVNLYFSIRNIIELVTVHLAKGSGFIFL